MAFFLNKICVFAFFVVPLQPIFEKEDKFDCLRPL